MKDKRSIVTKLVDWYINRQRPGEYVKQDDLKAYLTEAVTREAARIHSIRNIQEARLEERLKREHRAEVELLEIDLKRLNEMLIESEQWKEDLESLRLEVMKRSRFNEKIASDVAKSLERFKISLAAIVGQVQGVSHKAFLHNQSSYSHDQDCKEREMLGQRKHKDL